MKNQVIYDAALRLLAESTADGENEDYEERAPYLLAAFCTEMTELNAKLCEANGQTPVAHDVVVLPLEQDFPLADRLSAAATLYLSAMLILESDEERSDKLYAQYCDAVSRISDAIPAPPEPPVIPAILEPITNRYF